MFEYIILCSIGQYFLWCSEYKKEMVSSVTLKSITSIAMQIRKIVLGLLHTRQPGAVKTFGWAVALPHPRPLSAVLTIQPNRAVPVAYHPLVPGVHCTRASEVRGPTVTHPAHMDDCPLLHSRG